jgi:PIN domain nuclease of toxin-antitoxin system
VRLLLDSQVFIWSMTDPSLIVPAIRRAIDDAAIVHVSAASFWEISIKRARGRLEVPDDLFAFVDRAGYEALDITSQHGWLAGSLPRLHGDPFDRVLVAQAIVEGLTIVTSDRRIQEYGVPVLFA